MTDVARLDPVRSRMLADMGIDVWLRRETKARAGVETAGRQAAVRETEDAPSSVAAAAPAPTRTAVAAPSPPQQPVAVVHEPLSVTCLVSEAAVMLVDNAEPGVSRRLCQDMLAGVTGEWRSSPREITFSWPGSATPADGWRAFKAFAEKQLGESTMGVVLCSERLRDQLPDLSGRCELLALPGFSGLAAEDKRALWRRMQTLNR